MLLLNLKVGKYTCKRGTASRPGLLPGCSCRFEGVPRLGNCVTTPSDKLTIVRCNLRLSQKCLSLPSLRVVVIDHTCIILTYKTVTRKQMKMNKSNCALLNPLSTYFACTLSISKCQFFPTVSLVNSLGLSDFTLGAMPVVLPA